jgi:hypothetical protein
MAAADHPAVAGNAGPARQTVRVSTNDSDTAASWLLLIYRVPSEPTRLRASVWRRIKGLGAVYLQNSVAALPVSSSNERALRKLRHDIVDMGGTAMLMTCSALVGGGEIIDVFQTARSDEYEEIVDRARDFLRQVQKEVDAGHYTYAELEENEVDLAKLRSWLAKVAERDVFGAPGRSDTEEQLKRCDAALEAYAAEVYAREEDA